MFTLILITFCLGTTITSCMDSDKKIHSMNETIQAAKEKAENDKDAFVAEMKEYQLEWNSKYEQNKARIEKLKEDKKNNIKAAYKDKVEELEIANEIIKNEIDTIYVQGNLEWKNFKKSVDQEIKNLDESIDKFSEKKI